MKEERRDEFPIEEIIPELAHQEERVRYYAARLLGVREPEQLVPFLVDLLEDGTAPVRRAAARVLGELSLWSLGWRRQNALEREAEGRVVPVLVAALGDPDEVTRANSARSLGRLRREAAVVPLLGSLADPAAGGRRADGGSPEPGLVAGGGGGPPPDGRPGGCPGGGPVRSGHNPGDPESRRGPGGPGG